MSVRKIWQYDSLATSVSQSAETVQSDKLLPQYPSKIWDIKRNQYLYPSQSFQPPEISGITVYSASSVVITYPKQYQYQSISRPIGSTFPEVVLYDKYEPSYPDKIWDVKRQQFTYPSFFIDTQILTQGETVFIDKWFFETAKPRWDVKRWQFTYPNWFGKIDLPPEDIGTFWSQPQFPSYFFKKEYRYTYPSFFEGLEKPEEEGNADWMPPTNNPVFKIKQLNYLYNLLAQPSTQLGIDWMFYQDIQRGKLNTTYFLYPTIIQWVEEQPIITVIKKIRIMPHRSRGHFMRN